MIDRLFGGYPDLTYAGALHAGQLPPNIEVIEFFFLAGKWLQVPYAQQHYISANYTHAASYLLARGLNVVTQLVAKRVVDGTARYSLSCNTDTTLDVLRARSEGRASFKLIGQVNSELPFMPGPGDLPGDEFSAVLDSPETDFPLFAPPAEPISDTKYAIGLHAAALVPDGGTLQIGIGQVGDALAQGLDRSPPRQRAIPRHHEAARARESSRCETEPFEKGLYGVSEMLFEAFLGLIEAGILKRDVDGVMLHGAFFLGPKSFYRALREMPPEQLARIQMMPVSFTNQLYGDEAVQTARPRRCALRQQRDDGDFDGSCGFRRSRQRSGRQRRRRPVQFRGAGVRAGGRAIDPRAGSDAAGGEGHALQHPLELRPRDHSAASARRLRHRIWHCRRQGQVGRRDDRGDAAGHGLPLPGRTGEGGQGCRQAAEGISKFRAPIARIFRNGSRTP